MRHRASSGLLFVEGTACLERPCCCLEGWVFVGYIDEYGEESEASYPCRRCADSAR